MPPELFDTHCHLTSPELLGQSDCVLSAAQAAGVRQILLVACRPEEFDAALSLSSPYQGGARGDESPPLDRPALSVATGIHPHEAAKAQEQDWQALVATWGAPSVVAAGEMGLDYHYDFSPRDVQRAVFERQLDLAAQAGLPIVVHCREAQPDAVQILVDHGFRNRPVVFHCFSGTPEEAAELRSHGWWTSFTGVITFKNAAPVRRACLETALDRLMFETDSPYLSPEPVRRMRPNEPQNLVHTVRFAAGLRGEPFEELAARTTANARRFFRL
jgi:TatD DNase family protein